MSFVAQFPVRSLVDIRHLEETPLDQALTLRSTYEIFQNSAQTFGDKIALTFLNSGNPDDKPVQWSYAELLTGINQTANLLHRIGVTPNDSIGVLLPGCLEYHLALWGGEAAGIVQPLNPLLSDEKLVSLLNAGNARVLFAWGSDDDASIWSKALRIRSLVPTLTHLLRVAPLNDTSIQPLPAGVLDFEFERRGECSDRLLSGRRIEPTDIAAYFHTGGTTGAPKLARHSHGAQVFTAWVCVQMQGTRAADVVLNGYPLFHVAGALPGALTSFAAGSEVIMPTTALFRNREVIANYWRLVERYRATVVSAVPTVLAALANVAVGDADISTLRYCRTGAAPLSPDLAARFEFQFGIHVHESLGMTEMAGISTITPPGVIAPVGCVGFRLPHTQMRVVALEKDGRPTNRDMPTGQQGMVIFKSPNLFSGFVDPQDNQHAFTPDGWLVTGDLGWLDDEGRLNLSGRSKDLIIRSGHNIDPKVIEDAMASHPAVQHCAAIGQPDAYAGEVPVVFVTLKPGAEADEDELLAYVRKRVDEPPARPKAVTVLSNMPMTLVGKIFKPELRQLAAQTKQNSLDINQRD
jgi:fatty-acyl-CoA synthase